MQTFVAPLAVLGTVLTVVAVLYGAHLVVAVQREPLRAMSFVSGGEPCQHAVSRFHVRWYLVSLMLLAFDMEMLFMYPWALVVGSMGAASVIEMFTFLTLLVIGVVYAWREGAFRWA